MKKKIMYIAAALALLSMVTLTACSSENAGSSAASVSQSTEQGGDTAAASSPADITEKIQSDIEFPTMADISARTADYYDIDAAKIESVSAFICGSGSSPDEIAVFKLTSADDVSAAVDTLNKRVESRKSTFEDYTPEEMYKFGNNVFSKGQYVALLITADNNAAADIFNSMA